MTRTAVFLIAALATTNLWGSQQRPGVDRARLEWFKKLTPERKKELRERLEALKKLPPEERQRLVENTRRWRELPEDARRKIQERMDQLTPEERKRYGEVTQLYFRQAGKRALQGFPRDMFFLWLRNHHPGEMERIQDLEPAARTGHFEKLHAEFKQVSLERAEQHVRTHKCVPVERLGAVRSAGAGEFWPQLQALMQEVRSRHPQPPPRKPVEIRDRKPPKK